MKKIVATILGITTGVALSSQAALVHEINFNNNTSGDSVGGATTTDGAVQFNVPGRYNGGAFFGGTQDGYVQIDVDLIPTLALNSLGTHMFWFRTVSERNLADTQNISGWAWHAGDDPGAGVFHGKEAANPGVSGRLKVEVFDDPPSQNLAGSVENVTFGEWHHVAIARDKADDDRVALYFNGSLVSDTQAGPADSLLTEGKGFGWSWALGSTNQNIDRSYHGTIDEYRIYDTFLTESEVQAAMVPEPSIIALLGVAGLVLALRRRK